MRGHFQPVHRHALLLALPLVLLAIGGCGGGDDNNSSSTSTSATTPTTETSTSTTPASGGGSSTLKLSADSSGALKFDKSTLSTKAGDVTIDMKNPSPVQHNVAIEGNGVDEAGEVVSKGGTSTVSADLKAGKYTFYCSVDGHRQAGMQGTLTVK
jgi:plastocyanin